MVQILEMPARKEAGPISEDPEAAGVPHIGQLGVREGVDSPLLEGVPGGCWDYDACAS